MNNNYYFSEYPNSVNSLNGKTDAITIEAVNESITVDNNVPGKIRLKSNIVDPGGDAFVMKDSADIQTINSDIGLDTGKKFFGKNIAGEQSKVQKELTAMSGITFTIR
jgi:hypothetical protein